jgi:hypothetical protein
MKVHDYSFDGEELKQGDWPFAKLKCDEKSECYFELERYDFLGMTALYEISEEHTYLKAELADVQKNNLEAMDDIARQLAEINQLKAKVELYEKAFPEPTKLVWKEALAKGAKL